MKKQYTCKVCGQLGHNARRHGQSPVTSKTKVAVTKKENNSIPTIQKQSAPNKRCSYCRTRGHTSATCIIKFRDMSAFKEKYSLLLTNIASTFNSKGLNAGSIVRLKKNVPSLWAIRRSIDNISVNPEDQEEFSALKASYKDEQRNLDSIPSPIEYCLDILVLSDVSKCLSTQEINRNKNNHINLIFENYLVLSYTSIVNEQSLNPATERLAHFICQHNFNTFRENKSTSYYNSIFHSNIACFLTNTGTCLSFDLSRDQVINSENYIPKTVNYNFDNCWKGTDIKEILTPDDPYKKQHCRDRTRRAIVDLNLKLNLPMEDWLNYHEY